MLYVLPVLRMLDRKSRVVQKLERYSDEAVEGLADNITPHESESI